MTDKDKEHYKKLLDEEIEFLRKKRAGRFRNTEKDRLKLLYSQAVIKGLNTMLNALNKDELEEVKADIERIENLIKASKNK